MLFSLFLSVNLYFFYLHGKLVSGILNVFETNKHSNKMQNHWVVQIKLHILVIHVLRATAWFIKDHPIFCCCCELVQMDDKMRLVTQLDHLVAQKNHQELKYLNVLCEVCIQAGGGLSRCQFFCTTRWSNCTTEFSHLCQ